MKLVLTALMGTWGWYEAFILVANDAGLGGPLTWGLGTYLVLSDFETLSGWSLPEGTASTSDGSLFRFGALLSGALTLFAWMLGGATWGWLYMIPARWAGLVGTAAVARFWWQESEAELARSRETVRELYDPVRTGRASPAEYSEYLRALAVVKRAPHAPSSRGAGEGFGGRSDGGGSVTDSGPER